MTLHPYLAYLVVILADDIKLICGMLVTWAENIEYYCLNVDQSYLLL